MKVLLSLLTILLLQGEEVIAQNKESNFSISGYIKDAENGESLIGATVYSKEKLIGTTTNVYGFYSLTLPSGNHDVVVSYLGYRDSITSLSLEKDMQLTIELNPTGQQLDEVVISSEREDQNISELKMSLQKIEMKTVKELPITLGEADVIKTIQLVTPGVQSVGEGSNGFSVRGGNTDQNMILLDEAAVYNPTHLLGFFSTFNTNAIKDVTLYKGGIPAQYGGKIASVMDIRMKDGNNKRTAVSGGIGLLASNITIESPIQKDKSSFIVSARRSYFDLIFAHVNNDEAINNNKVFFYDVNAKANFTLGKKDRIFISGYTGRDKFRFGKEFGLNWGNNTGTLRWNHIYNNKLFSNTSLISSDFDYGITLGTGDNQADFVAGIRDHSLKQDFDWFINDKNQLSFGFQSTYHTYNPGKVESGENSTYNNFEVDKKYAWENSVYITNKQEITKRLAVQYGLRGTAYSLIGPSREFVFDDPDDRHPTDTMTFESGEFYQTYYTLEPRLMVRYHLNENSSIKASYDRNSQNIHLASNTMVALPTDLQLPSSMRIKPEISDQVALGYFRNFKNNEYESSIEVYYKEMQNQIEFRNGADIFANPFIERELVFGKGWSYGTELFVRKAKGKTTGLISYTLSWSKRQFDDINNGEEFFASIDRRNVFNAVVSQKVNNKWTLSATWSYADGNAVSFPTGKMELDGQTIAIYSEKNAYRMPANHHLDLSANYKVKQKRKIKSEWNFSIYNVYARQNPWIYSFRESETNDGQMEAVKLYLFSIVPSVSWNFKF
ncbi:MAG: TonB-dependent receptor [Bacteroidia bacterium]|nr:TonB-dependent receptor [Bacteroidia bacterium]